jgi:hypothetical protein
MFDRRLRTQWTETKERKLRSACGVAHTRQERSRSGCLFVSFHSATYHCKECTRATMSDRGSPSDTLCRTHVRKERRLWDKRKHSYRYVFFRNAHSFHISLMPSSPFDSYAPSFTWRTNSRTDSVSGLWLLLTLIHCPSQFNLRREHRLHDGSLPHGDVTTTDRPS